MNRLTLTGLGLAVAATVVPVDTQAITARAGLEACTAALVQRIEAENGASPGYRFDRESTVGGRIPGHGLWHLDVRDPDSEQIVARADCRVDRQARVKELITLPLSAADAKTRAR